MASTPDFITFVCDQASRFGRPTYRRMFGEYAVYWDGKVVALVCDNQLYLKPTARGRRLLDAPVEAHPFPGSTPWWLVVDGLEDGGWLSQLFVATASELPVPPPKKPRAAREPAATKAAPRKAAGKKAAQTKVAPKKAAAANAAAKTPAAKKPLAEKPLTEKPAKGEGRP